MAAYNPYNDAQQIVNKKQLYNKSVASKSGDQDLYAQSAQVYYKNLRDNGYGDLADELSKADEATAVQILARYGGPTNTNRTPAVSSGKILPEAQVYKVNTGSVNGTAPTYNSNMQGGLSILDQYIQPSAAQQQSNSQAQSNLQATFDLFNRNNANTEARGNDLWGQMSQYGIDQTKRYEDLYGYIKDTSAVDTPEGKSIMSYYNNLGGQAAKGATANAAGANAGNIDSYSAANANRQQLSFTNAGTQAALNQKNSNAGNMLATLQSLGVDVGDLQNRQIAMYQGDQNYNSNILGKYTEGQNNVAGQLQAQQNAGNGLISDYMTNLLGVNTNDAALKQTQITSDAALKQTELTNKSTEVIKALDVALEKYKTDSSAASALAVQNAANEAEIIIQQLKNDGLITEGEYAALEAQIKAAADITVSENNKAGTLGAASIRAQGGIEEAKITADGKKATVTDPKEDTAGLEEFNAMTPEEKVQTLYDSFNYYLSEGKTVSEARLIMLQMFPKEYATAINTIAKDFAEGKGTNDKTADDYATDILG